MTKEDRITIERINAYAENVLKDIDPQNTRVSFQIQQITPILKTIAKERGISVEDMFILYMDLATEFSKEREEKLKADQTDLGFLDMGSPSFTNQ